MLSLKAAKCGLVECISPCVLQVFQKELGKRTGSVQALKRSARELIESSHDDSSWVKVQMQELSMRWDTVCSLSVSKQTRLEQALCQVRHATLAARCYTRDLKTSFCF